MKIEWNLKLEQSQLEIDKKKCVRVYIYVRMKGPNIDIGQ